VEELIKYSEELPTFWLLVMIIMYVCTVVCALQCLLHLGLCLQLGYTALHRAATQGHIEVIRALAIAGSPIDCCDYMVCVLHSHYCFVCKINTIKTLSNKQIKKLKIVHIRLLSVGFRSWSWFLAISLQVTCVINSAIGCHYFPSGPQLPPPPCNP